MCALSSSLSTPTPTLLHPSDLDYKFFFQLPELNNTLWRISMQPKPQKKQKSCSGPSSPCLSLFLPPPRGLHPSILHSVTLCFLVTLHFRCFLFIFGASIYLILPCYCLKFPAFLHVSRLSFPLFNPLLLPLALPHLSIFTHTHSHSFFIPSPSPTLHCPAAGVLGKEEEEGGGGRSMLHLMTIINSPSPDLNEPNQSQARKKREKGKREREEMREGRNETSASHP